MKAIKNLVKALIVLTIVIAFPLSSNASKDVTLRFNLEKGSSVKYRTTIIQTTTQSMGGMQQEVKQNQIFEYTIVAKDKDKQGNIPLHYAVQQSSESGRLEVIIALVGRDDESIIAAPYNVYEFYNQFYSKNKDGNTPYDLASSQNFPDMDVSPKSLLKEEHLNKTQMVGKAVMAVAVAALAVGIALSAWWVALAAAAVIGGLLLAEEYAKKKLNPLEVKIENTSMNEIGEGRISFAKSVESSPQVDPNQKGGGRDL